MNKNNDINDERLADDNSITAMNKEYAMRLIRDKMYPKCDDNNVSKYHRCMPNCNDIARCYFLECDILVSLNFLHQKSRMQCTRNTIKHIIKIKEQCKDKLLRLYIKCTGHTLSYAPKIIDRMTYNALYQEISYMQCELLARLNDILGICQIIYAEHTATLMLYSIKP